MSMENWMKYGVMAWRSQTLDHHIIKKCFPNYNIIIVILSRTDLYYTADTGNVDYHCDAKVIVTEP